MPRVKEKCAVCMKSAIVGCPASPPAVGYVSSLFTPRLLAFLIAPHRLLANRTADFKLEVMVFTEPTGI